MNNYDAVLVGGGIMSSTLAVLLHELDPEMKLLMVERLESPGLESSAATNNAGTGHAANCELNYTPLLPNGSIDPQKALSINAAFELSLDLWASLASLGRIDPAKFLNQIAHISFVWGEKDVAYLQKRFEKIVSFKAFSKMEFSSDFAELSDWMPLVMEGRSSGDLFAGTRVERGTDIDFGVLTQLYLEPLVENNSLELRLRTEVKNLYRNNNLWRLELDSQGRIFEIQSKFVFLGCGGGALHLLQRSGIPEGLSYAGFPVSGQWLICSDEFLVDQHNAKVYGKAKLGSPPMSVPHLDSRWISGKKSLLFGPFAGFSSKFLKNGSYLDLFKSITTSNMTPMLQVGLNNITLIKYLLNQLLLTENDRLDLLKDFCPKASLNDWKLSIAGQRVQIIKNTPNGGVLQMGTELVTSEDGSLAVLLGASPGASTAVKAMMEVLERCWPDQMRDDLWKDRLTKLLPSYGLDLNKNHIGLEELRQRTKSFLGL